MNKEEMKDFIPLDTDYCYKGDYVCPWHKYIETIKLHRIPPDDTFTLCPHSDTCDSICWSNRTTSCKKEIWRCEYLDYTDYEQESLLWDSCKECGVELTEYIE